MIFVKPQTEVLSLPFPGKFKISKLDADWTYLIMKVRQMRANKDINGKDPEKQTNERTRERMSKQANE